MAEYIEGYQYVNAIDALSLFESEYSRVKLIEVMAKELHSNILRYQKIIKNFVEVYIMTI
ncbi:hypothetical protein [Cellulosilyticum lentocellum]|uniref:Uncharacterized protein n=1 Tax=Cellulosilyticum lentocellum (strain ATCC 49066 / DSM 5427 / NCIMB 11756 / RHM5) TaxID=642492 RepID=F2JKX2_CELLD|nr:hypothetical protein [Cellulosilyticum lentocellum]ADZ84513.1 hypothetical protein Clole_2814 [Cellulosilyticum lentocellum DSM 5427]